MHLYEVWFRLWSDNTYIPLLIEADTVEDAIKQAYSQINKIGSLEYITQN